MILDLALHFLSVNTYFFKMNSVENLLNKKFKVPTLHAEISPRSPRPEKLFLISAYVLCAPPCLNVTSRHRGPRTIRWAERVPVPDFWPRLWPLPVILFFTPRPFYDNNYDYFFFATGGDRCALIALHARAPRRPRTRIRQRTDGRRAHHNARRVPEGPRRLIWWPYRPDIGLPRRFIIIIIIIIIILIETF